MVSSIRAEAHAEIAREENRSSVEAQRTHIEALLCEVSDAVDHGLLTHAHRLADRARRLSPGDPACLILCARLLTRIGRPSEALDLLLGLEEPAAMAARGEAFCMLERWSEALPCCEFLLERFAVDAVDGVRNLATLLCRADNGLGLPGWVGVEASYRLTGCTRYPDLLRIRAGDRHLRPESDSDARNAFCPFTCEAPQGFVGTVEALSRGKALLGSGAVWPPRFDLAAWVVLEGGALVGEARFGWSPSLAVTLSIDSGEGRSREIAIDPGHGVSPARFRIPLEPWETNTDRLEVFARTPDGARQPLIGSPIQPGARSATPVGQRTVRQPGGTPAERSGTGVREVDVVIPVYAGYEETLACVHSVLATTDDAEIVVVDDASPDPELRRALEALAGERRITLLTNARNLGFPASANRGMRLHPDRDIVLLNSDTEVFGDWLARLRKAAYRGGEVGTVTPLGEGDTITEYSRMPRRGTSAAEIDRMAALVNAEESVAIPVGVGFCLYVKRECLNQTGELDERMFARGYGEECDFCLRARDLGWIHVASAGVYVSHVGGRSFGRQAKELLLKRSRSLLNTLHPGYDETIEEFHRAQPLLAARRAIDLGFLKRDSVRPVLLVTLDLPGGVKRHVDERAAHLAAEGCTAVTLHPVEGDRRKGRIKLDAPGLGLKNLFFDLPGEFPLLKDTLGALGLSHVEIHHFLGLPPEALELATGLGVPFDLYVHDYLWICPRVTLIGGDGKYCGEPAVSACEKCVQLHGGAVEESLTVEGLRERSARILSKARKVIAPSDDTRHRFARYFPDVEIVVTPWEKAVEPMKNVARSREGPVRVAVIGAIGIQKGHQVLVDCAKDAQRRGLELEFVVFGYTLDDALLHSTGKAFVVGPYKDDEIDRLLERERCNAAFFPSLWPETWCYSLTHAIRNGLPVAAFDCGAQAERLRDREDRELLPFSATPEQINDTLIRLSRKSSSSRITKEDVMDQSPSTQGQPVSGEINSSVQILTLPEGVYSFTVQGGAGAEELPGEVIVPALQVSLPPVRTAGRVEFLTAASSLGHWLAYESDMVIVRVTGEDASLMLTSIRREDSPTLDVSVNRLSAEPLSQASGEDRVALAEPRRHREGPSVRLHTHIKNVGDLEFQDCWAGWPGQQLWIEGFSVSVGGSEALEAGFSNSEIEYCAVTADGFETPWQSNEELCGSRGAGMPILGFGVRLKPAFAGRYDCLYRGRFFSGATIGPLSGGALCCSDLPGDPLEGLEVQLTRRPEGEPADQNADKQYSLET